MKTADLNSVILQLKPYLPQYLESKGVDISKNFKCLSPNHDDDNPSCGLVGLDSDFPRAHCFSCNKYFDIFDAVQVFEKRPKMGTEWIKDTLGYLASKYNVDIPKDAISEEDAYKLDIYRAYKAASEYISSDNRKGNVAFQKEIDRRNWEPDTLDMYGVGTVESFQDFYDGLIAKGFSPEFLKDIELARSDIFNQNSMIHIWHNASGNPIGFTCRNLLYEEEKKEADKNGKKYSKPKYNNIRTSGIRVNIFNKHSRLYGLYHALKYPGPLYVFEGQGDVITARHNGLVKCVALAGSSMHQEQVFLLKKLNQYDIVLCLDGDSVGKKKTAEIVEKRLSGNRDLRVRIIELPEDEDPDSFIRKNGVEEFLKLASWSAFEWKLNQYSDDVAEDEICRQMISLIANEPSPIIREQLCTALSRRTGFTLKAINDELDILIDEQSHIKARQRQEILDKMTFDLRRGGDEVELVLQKTQKALSELSKKHDQDSLSNEDFVKSLDQQKKTEESAETKDTGFRLSKDLKEFEETLRGEWSEGVFMCFGGKENTGKSAFLCKAAYDIATYNDNVCVIYHTIDDTQSQLTPRFVTIADDSCKLSINMVRQPNYWSSVVGNWIYDRREKGYAKIRELAQNGKLVIKDVEHGANIAFIERIISYYQNKYPGRKIVFMLDNFHKLRGYEHYKDDRLRFKAMSEDIKNIAACKKCCIMSTVEYHKIAPGYKPNNNTIGETVQVAYDANFIAHLYNEVSDVPESFTVCHKDKDWQGKTVLLPRVEFIIGKNKITEQKSSFFLDFFPSSSNYRHVDHETVLRDAREMKEERKQRGKGSIDDIEDDLYSKK